MTWAKRRAIVIIVVVLVIVVGIGFVAWRPAKRIAANSVLVIDAEGSIEEQRSVDLFASFTGNGTPVLSDYIDAIDSAATDSRISGIVLRIAPLDTGWAKIEEIRTHLLAYQSSGKPSICYLGYDGIGNLEYYLASACKEIWLIPTNPVDVRGMMAEALFFRGSLDKLKIVPEFYHIAEYKTAYNTLTEKKFTAPHREEVESVLRSVYNQYLSDASQARHLDRAKFEALVAQGPFDTDDAVGNKLVDRLAYWDQVQSYFKTRDHHWNPVDLNRYRSQIKDHDGQQIAVIHATGLIVSGESQTTPGGGFVMGGDSVASDIRDARTDSNIRAIILRIDSGGGSVVGSEVIRREVELAKDTKPVIVSMSDVAASGGYWIAAPAQKIIADPNTITGSIGVLTGKLNLSGLYNLLGMSTDYVATGDNATLFSDQQNFTPQQEAYIQKSLQDTYAQFLHGVAEGRHLSVDAVDKIGKGREWTGAQAKDIGLVDELGGFDRAIAVAKDLAHIPASESVSLVNFPEEKSLFQEIFEHEKQMVGESRSGSVLGALAGLAIRPESAAVRLNSATAPESIDALLRRIAAKMEPIQARIPYELHIR